MTSPRRSATSWGGLAILVGGSLLSGSLLAISLLPDPPAHDPALLAWVEKHSSQVSLSNELLFFAVVLLLPAVISAGVEMGKSNATAALLGCSSFLIALILLGMLVVVEGRLVYPVFGIELDEGTAALVVSLLFGGLHTVQLLLGIGLIALGFGLRATGGRWFLVISLTAGVLQLAGAFPWLTPTWVNAAVNAVLFFWTLGTASWLLRNPAGPRASSEDG